MAAWRSKAPPWKSAARLNIPRSCGINSALQLHYRAFVGVLPAAAAAVRSSFCHLATCSFEAASHTLIVLIAASGDNPLPVRGKRHGKDPTAVPFEGEQFLAGGRVPQLGRLIRTAGDNPMAIRGKHGRVNMHRCAL